MPTRWPWSRILAVVGLAAVLVGTIDPLEGSVLILAGAAILALSAWLGRSRFRALLSWALVLLAVGVGVLFGLSALGGIGGSTGRPMWWAIFLLPYPAGWLMALLGAIRRLREGPRTAFASATQPR